MRARVIPNGNLFTGNGFLVPEAHDADPVKRSVIKGVFPWIGGTDPSGQVRMSAAALGGPQSDFKAGILGRPGFDQVWRVTGDEIRAHRADFYDNGVIDNPIPAIMNWPQPITYPGATSVQTAPFFDGNSNEIYEPELGEFPTLRPDYIKFIPSEILFFAFHDSTDHAHSHGSYTPIQVFCTVFATNCPEQPALHNSVFASYRYVHRGYESIKNLYFGFFIDYEIGNGNDDFLASVNGESFLAYNGDAVDEGGFENNPPVVAVSLIWPVITNHDISDKANFIPIYPGPPNAVQYPQLPHEFYGYMKSQYKNDTPLTAAGTGYNPGLSEQPVCCAFPGDPTAPDGWSERTAGNIPGDRRAVVAFGPVMMLPSTRASMLVAFHWARGDTPGPLSGYVPLQEHLQWIQGDMPYSHYDISLDSPCPKASPSSEIPAPAMLLQISPNPAATSIRVKWAGGMLQHAHIFDVSGRSVLFQSPSDTGDEGWEINIENLPAGLYILEILDRQGRRGWGKFVVSSGGF